MSAIAMITARGGSKRIPKKNIRPFLGQPIIAYSIQAALASGVFDEVMVSTDSEEIAQIARACGASVPFMRSAKASDDYASTDDVIKEVLTEYEKCGKHFDSFCCIYPTAPFVTPDKLKYAMELLKTADSVMPVVAFSYPPLRGLQLNEKGELRRIWPEYANARSQDLPTYYHDCGQFYCCKTAPFLENGTTDLDNMVPMLMDEMEVQDIDTFEDWEIAELKYRKMLQKQEESSEKTNCN